MSPMSIDLSLRDIHLPATIPHWPPALGWWIVIFILVGLFLIVFWLIWTFFRPSLKKEAAKELAAIEKEFLETSNSIVCLTALSLFLRKVSISIHSQASCPAGLTGEAWLNWLDQKLQRPEFSQGAGRLLLTGPYRLEVNENEVSALLQLCKLWVSRL